MGKGDEIFDQNGGERQTWEKQLVDTPLRWQSGAVQGDSTSQTNQIQRQNKRKPTHKIPPEPKDRPEGVINRQFFLLAQGGPNQHDPEFAAPSP